MSEMNEQEAIDSFATEEEMHQESGLSVALENELIKWTCQPQVQKHMNVIWLGGVSADKSLLSTLIWHPLPFFASPRGKYFLEV